MGSFDSSCSNVLPCDSWLHSAVTQNVFLDDFVLQISLTNRKFDIFRLQRRADLEPVTTVLHFQKK